MRRAMRGGIWSVAAATSLFVSAGCGGGSGNTGSSPPVPANASTQTTPPIPPDTSPGERHAPNSGAVPSPKVVVLNWAPPSVSLEGTALPPVAGYRVLYGRTPEELDQSVQISGEDIVDCALESLEPGLWYFAVVTQTREGIEGPPSNVVWKIVA